MLQREEGRGPEEEGSETGTCSIPLPTTERPKLCHGLTKTCGRLSSGHQLKHTAEESVKTCCWPALLWGCTHHCAPWSRAEETPALPTSALEHRDSPDTLQAPKQALNSSELFSEFLWEVYVKYFS